MRAESTRRRTAIALAAVACLSACASAPPPRPVPPVRDPGDLIARVLANADSLLNVRIRARVSLEIDGVRQNASSVCFYEAPDDMRLEISGPLGVSLLSSLFIGDSLRVYLPGDGGYLDGPAPRVLYQVTGMNLGYYDTRRVILGLPSFGPADRASVVAFSTTPTDYVLDIRHPGYIRRALVNRTDLTLRREDILDLAGIRRSGLSLDGYRTISGVRLPGEIKVYQDGNHISISVESAQVNEGLEAGVFVLNLPQGARRLSADR